MYSNLLLQAHVRLRTQSKLIGQQSAGHVKRQVHVDADANVDDNQNISPIATKRYVYR